jgi:hypothetical protein
MLFTDSTEMAAAGNNTLASECLSRVGAPRRGATARGALAAFTAAGAA